MKSKIISFIRVIIVFLVYFTFLVIAKGNHTIMLPSVLMISAIISFLLNKSIIDDLIMFAPFMTFFIFLTFSGAEIVFTTPYIFGLSSIIVLTNLYRLYRKMNIIIISFIFLGLHSFFIFPNFLNLLYNLETFKENKTNGVFPKLDIELVENSQNLIMQPEHTYVFYFWGTSCGSCIRKMPDIEKLSNYYTSFEKVHILSVCVPVRDEDENDLKAFINNFNYKINFGITEHFDEMKEKVGVSAFPTLVIVKNGDVEYFGRYIDDPLVVFNNVYSEIERIAKLD